MSDPLPHLLESEYIEGEPFDFLHNHNDGQKVRHDISALCPELRVIPRAASPSGPSPDPDTIEYDVAVRIARNRHGPGVKMDGSHNPTPSEWRLAREIVEDVRAASPSGPSPAASHAEEEGSQGHDFWLGPSPAAACSADCDSAGLDVERLARAMEDFFGHDEWYFDSPEADFTRYAQEIEERYREDGASGDERINDGGRSNVP